MQEKKDVVEVMRPAERPGVCLPHERWQSATDSSINSYCTGENPNTFNMT